MQLLYVQYAANLKRGIIYYRFVEADGYSIAYNGRHRVEDAINGGPAIFNAKMSNNVQLV